MNWYKKASLDNQYPLAGSSVSGLNVRSEVPNVSSIQSSLSNYKILNGIREVQVSDFNVNLNSFFYSKDDFNRAHSLSEQIKQSKEISPLIIVIDSEGPYILEGGHRIYALKTLGITTFPAMVVLDLDMMES